MNFKDLQAGFFDEHPGLYPWPDLLVERGFGKTYKPRDAKFKKYLAFLGIKKGEKVLDLGCGAGIFLARIVKTYKADGTGVDISKKSIEAAKKWESPHLRFLAADATRLPFKDGSFDHVLSFDTLEHVRQQRKALSEMARVLKVGGSLLIYTINKNQRYTWNFFLDKLGIDIYKRVAHDPRLFLDPRWVRKELEGMGIGVERVELFDSFFTLAADEAMMVLLLGLKRLDFFDSSARFKIAVGRIFLDFANLFSHFSVRPLEVLEIPWKKFGYSNSFFILGRKRI